jgi:hypothetical protein
LAGEREHTERDAIAEDRAVFFREKKEKTMNLTAFHRTVRSNSYRLTAAAIWLFLVYHFLIKSFTPFGLLVIVGAAGLLILGEFVLRPGHSEVQNAEQVLQAIGNGRPTFLNIYSNH